MQNKNSSLPNKVYTLMVLFAILIAVILVRQCDIPSQMEQANKDSYEFTPKWFAEDGSEVEDISHLNKLAQSSKTEEKSITCTLPDTIQNNTSLCFRNKHMYLSAYIDGELVYEQTLPENRMYTNSVGVTWVFIPLEQEYAGKQLEIRYQLCYTSTAGIDNVKISNERGYVLDLLNEKVLCLVTSLMYITIGLIVIFFDIIINFRKKEKQYELLYIGEIALSVAAYCMIETLVFQLYTGNERIMHLLSCFSLLLVPIPIVQYTNSFLGYKFKYTAQILTGISFASFLLLFVLNFYDIADYHDMMTLIHVNLFAAIGSMYISIIRYIRRKLKEHQMDVFVYIEAVGLIIISVTGILDVIRYYAMNAQDPALFTRFGMLFFLICYVIASSKKIVEAFKTSSRVEFISKLAYIDGLTDLCNRTAYEEKLSELDEEGNPFGIVMLDVNNLKQVNDQLGHQQGDALLQMSAAFILKAFNEDCFCFRVGGDEFAVLVPGFLSAKKCEKGIARLQEIYTKYNQDHKDEMEYKIIIASGYSVYQPGGKKRIRDAIKDADNNMYRNKKYLKGLA